LQPAEVAEGNSGRSVMGEPPGMLVARALPSGPNPFRAALPYFLDALLAGAIQLEIEATVWCG
jgi:hypothetical protein